MAIMLSVLFTISEWPYETFKLFVCLQLQPQNYKRPKKRQQQQKQRTKKQQQMINKTLLKKLDCATHMFTQTGSEPMCSGRISSSCFTRVVFKRFTNPVVIPSLSFIRKKNLTVHS